MIQDWEPLVDSLRDEVQEYGCLLNLFEEQQTAILRRQPEVVLAVNDAIEIQTRTIRVCRQQRETLVRNCAVQAGQSEESRLGELLERFADGVRPLLAALIDEINRLVGRMRRRAHQNHMLLARSVEVSQQMLQRLSPDGLSKTYSLRGRVSITPAGVRSRRLAQC